MHDEFANFLAGDNSKFLREDPHAQVPFVTPWDTSLLDKRVKKSDQKLQVLERVSQQKIPWGNRNLLHIPGAHKYLSNDIVNRRQFDAYIGALHYTGPQTMEQAWHYFKFIVKGAQPDRADLDAMANWQPNKVLPGAEEEDDDFAQEGGYNAARLGGDAGDSDDEPPPDAQEDDEQSPEPQQMLRPDPAEVAEARAEGIRRHGVLGDQNRRRLGATHVATRVLVPDAARVQPPVALPAPTRVPRLLPAPVASAVRGDSSGGESGEDEAASGDEGEDFIADARREMAEAEEQLQVAERLQLDAATRRAPPAHAATPDLRPSGTTPSPTGSQIEAAARLQQEHNRAGALATQTENMRAYYRPGLRRGNTPPIGPEAEAVQPVQQLNNQMSAEERASRLVRARSELNRAVMAASRAAAVADAIEAVPFSASPRRARTSLTGRTPRTPRTGAQVLQMQADALAELGSPVAGIPPPTAPVVPMEAAALAELGVPVLGTPLRSQHVAGQHVAGWVENLDSDDSDGEQALYDQQVRTASPAVQSQQTPRVDTIFQRRGWMDYVNDFFGNSRANPTLSEIERAAAGPSSRSSPLVRTSARTPEHNALLERTLVHDADPTDPVRMIEAALIDLSPVLNEGEKEAVHGFLHNDTPLKGLSQNEQASIIAAVQLANSGNESYQEFVPRTEEEELLRNNALRKLERLAEMASTEVGEIQVHAKNMQAHLDELPPGSPLRLGAASRVRDIRADLVTAQGQLTKANLAIDKIRRSERPRKSAVIFSPS
jgi:hypothetical protein